MLKVFRAAKSAGEVAGGLAAMIGLPAVIFGFYAFSGEIYDSLTAPDVTVEVESMTLRCFYRFQDPEQFARFSDGDRETFIENCDAAPVALSFTAEVTNHDRIRRTVTGFSAELSLAIVADPVAFTRTWEVAHEIHGAAETNIRRNWYTVELSPSRTTRHEVWIEQQGPELEALPWGPVRSWLADPTDPPVGALIEALIFIDLAGRDAQELVAICRFPLKADALGRFRALPPVRQLRFTALCQPDTDRQQAA
ncbi:MAG TPA: hypothetical protein PKA33_18255 [Amaricoccus sp.]|uniref:hypothetical protein n=1 Tax=Amaricoccus sp. TaxID=1872485 RepID=UPI002CB42220|nr:hypothetical protein [Amaricoccus sp.]HMQ94829.1 hypothetical protein [Amaricoccus sp.]HMR54284.1 hypothetical protein [Amaricoccus sp.]HMU01291.1 hypothetical protein [Amaricoccus sp.]